MEQTIKKHKEPLLHIAKRDDMPGWKAWLIRFAAIFIGLLVCGILSSLITGTGFFDVYDIMFKGVFGRIFEGKTALLWRFLQQVAILLCLSLAVTPAFRMRFWNCGAEGQALVGGLAAMVCMIEIGDAVPQGLLLVIIVICSILAGAIWGLIPAIFQAQYKTNETLFTLMMNYVASQIVAYYVYVTGSGSGIIQPVATGNLPILFGERYLLNVLVVAVLMVAMYIYLQYSKHGYEICVVGESQNTARYAGINVKKIIIRTMIISGALAVLVGLFLAGNIHHTISTASANNMGFTAILATWLAAFNPLVMIATCLFITFISRGMVEVRGKFGFTNDSIANIVIGLVYFCVIACSFFITYKVVFRKGLFTKKQKTEGEK